MTDETRQPASPDGPAAAEPDRAADNLVTGSESGGPRYATPKRRGRQGAAHRAFNPAKMCGAHLKNCPICSLDSPDGDVPFRECPHAHDWTTCEDDDHRCRQARGWYTSHPGYGLCKFHFGNAPARVAQAQQEAAVDAAIRAMAKLGVHVEKDPQSALLELVWEAAGNVAFLRGRVNALLEAEGIDATIGNTYAVVQRDAITLPIGEEARGVVKLYGEWCDRLAKYAKSAIDAGIAEREVKLAEQEATMIVHVIEVTLAGIGATPEQYEHGRQIASRELTMIASAHPERN